VTYYEALLGPAFALYEAAIPALGAITIWIALRTRLPKKQKLALPLAASALLGGLLHDTFVSRGLLSAVYIAEYCWFGVIFLMSRTLTNEVVDAALTKRTLEAVEERIAITLDSIQDAVITTDNEGRVVHLNPAAERILGTSLAEARKRPLQKLVTVRSRETGAPVRDPVQYALSRPPDPYGTLPFLTPVATRRTYRVDQTGAPLRRRDGRLMGAVIVYRDLTIQHDALVELQHSQKMRSMGQLAGGVAHDLNNLLTPIISYSEMSQRLLDEKSPAHAYLGHVMNAAERAAQLTRQLLALSRKQILDARVVSLNAIVHGCEPLLRRLVPEDVSVRVKLDPQAGNVRVDSSQLEQVLLNLVANARDAMPRGGEIEIVTQRDSAELSSVVVRDTGEGMSDEVRERIFEPFFTTKPRGKGTGLGLPTVRGIVEQHGGSIEVRSEPGKGSTFRIALPSVSREVPDVARGIPAAPAAGGGTETILVVEDDPAVRRLTEDALRELGYSVLTAADAKEALALPDGDQVRLLLTDVVMPGTSGPELYALMRERSPGLRCLYMTGHADDLLGDRGFLERGTQLVRKPFTLSVLAAKVRDVLDRELDRSSQSGVR
jgi:PAS domain S-box-containing protein